MSDNTSGTSPSSARQDAVQFEGPWTSGETDLVEHAVGPAGSAEPPATSGDVTPLWVATKHAFPSFTLFFAYHVKTKGVLMDSGSQALAEQINQLAHPPDLPAGDEAIQSDEAALGDSAKPAPIFQLVYQSVASKRINKDDVRQLLHKARSKNERLGITGVLLYKKGLFLQVLEGDEETVRALYDTICSDPRHHGVETLFTTHVGHRLFPDWTMGIEDLARADVTAGAPEVTSFLQSGRSPANDDLIPVVARALEQFKDMTESPSGDGPSSSYRLLVIEDSPVTRQILQLIFEDEAHTVDMAHTVDEAIFKAEENDYDALVLDVNLGERRTGVEALHAIRRMPHYEDVPAVAITAYELQNLESVFQEVGFSAVVTKPVTKRALLQRIEEAIENPIPEAPSLSNQYEDLQLPPLPSTIPKLLNLIALGDAQERDYERLINILSRDQVLATWLIRTANSAFFKLSSKIESVEAAIHYLGFRPTCNLLLGKLLSERFSGFESDREKQVYDYVMRLGLGAAHLTRSLAKRLQYPHPEVAHSAVLMTQLGRLLLLKERRAKYAALWFKGDGSIEPPPIGQETLAFSTNYISVGVKVGQQSELSGTLLRMIRYHRRPAQVAGRDQKRLAYLVALGLEIYAAMIGQPMAELQRKLLKSRLLKDVMEQAAIDRRDLMAAIHDELERARAFVDEVFT